MSGFEGTASEPWVEKLTDTGSIIEPSETPTLPNVQSSSAPIGGFTADELINSASPAFNAAHPGWGDDYRSMSNELIAQTGKTDYK